MKQFIKDCDVDNLTFRRIKKHDHGYIDGGRYAFYVKQGNKRILVHMVGLPLKQVRYIQPNKQNIWHYPRLYVDGSSWVWYYALSQVNKFFNGED